MLKMIGASIRISIFIVAVLVSADWLEWNGKSLSERVRESMNTASQTTIGRGIGAWADQISYEVQSLYREKFGRMSSEAEEITLSERQKLRELIRDLNQKR